MIKSLFCKMFLKNKKESQRGVSLYLAVVILAILLPVAIGLSSIVIFQFKMTRELGNSVVAFYAADSGLERTLKAVFDHIDNPEENPLEPSYPGSLDNDSKYEARVVCCWSGNESCYYYSGAENPKQCPSGLQEDENCKATRFCVRSVGSFKNTKRAIEVKIFSID